MMTKVQVIEARCSIQELIHQKDRPKYAGKWHSIITFLNSDGKVTGVEMKCHECQRDAEIYLRMCGFDDQ